MEIFRHPDHGSRGVSFEELLKTLRAEYLASLPQKVDLIKKQIATGSKLEIRDSFHKLKGTGRTYGLPEVSELAEVTEAICMEKADQSETAAEQAVAILQEIYTARQQGQAFALEQDPRFQLIRKLLQN